MEHLLIEVRHGDVEHALRTMKKLMLKDGVFKEMKRRTFFEKPSVRLRRTKAEAQRRLRKEEKTLAMAEVDRKPHHFNDDYVPKRRISS